MSLIIKTSTPNKTLKTENVVVTSKYRDLSLNLRKKTSLDPYGRGQADGNDIELSDNISAIRNSLINLLMMKRGERVFNKSYGMALEQFIGAPLDQYTAYDIAETIQEQISNFERRIRLKKIFVVPNEDLNQFVVTILADVPSLGEEFSVNGILPRDGTSLLIG